MNPASRLATPAKSSFWRSVKTVAWSFVGLRQSGHSEADVAHINPLHLVLVGLVGCFTFVIGLMVFVNWVIAK